MSGVIRARAVLVCLAVTGLPVAVRAQATEPPPTSEAPAAPAAPAAGEPSGAAPAPEPVPLEPAPVLAPQTANMPGEAAEPERTTEEVEAEPVAVSATEQRESEPIIVTGSRIKRTSFASAAPVEVIDRRQLEYSGAQNLAEVVKYLSVASGSDFNGAGQGVAGTTAVNLRGLGSQATLILINGRRVVQSAAVSTAGTTPFVDLGQVPVTAIERIEILRAGASAIYGSDAVAGVINVITRKNYNGLTVEANGQSASRFDQGEYLGSVTYGASSENARVNLSLTYNRVTELRGIDRSFTRGTYISNVGNPGTFIVLAPGMSRAKLGVNPDPECARAPGSKVDKDGFCTNDWRPYFDLVAPRERVSVLGYGEYDLTDHTTTFAEFGYSGMRTAGRLPPSFPMLEEVTVPANHIDNPWGVDARYFGAPLGAGYPAGKALAEDDTVRVAAGLKGDFEALAANTFAESWEWELYGTWGRSRYHTGTPDIITAELQAAINACSDPQDLSRCFNPFYSSVTGKGTPNSKSVIDRFSGTMSFINDSILATGGAGLTGKLFALPGGDVGFALGTQLRYEARASNGDHDANQLAYGFFLGNSDARAQRDISAGYLELLWPFYDGIELQTAGRLEHYEGTGDSLSPSAGLLITPAEIVGRDNVADGFRRLRLRGTANSAFRAPSLYESYPGFITNIQQFNGEGPTPVFRPVRLHGNTGVKPEKATVLTGGLEWSPLKQLGLSGNYWYYNYRDLIIAEDAQHIYAIDKNDPRIDRDASGNLLAVNTTGENAAFIKTQGVDAGAMLNLDLNDLGITASPAGVVSLGVQGTYVIAFDIPRDQVADVPRTGKKPIGQPGCNADRCDVAGLRNQNNFAYPMPRWRANFPLSWVYEGHTASVVLHYISGYDDDANPDPATGAFAHIDSYTTLDLSYGYKLKDVIGQSTTLRAGVLNVFDATPPYVKVFGGYDVYTHDPRGRMIFAQLSQEF